MFTIKNMKVLIIDDEQQSHLVLNTHLKNLNPKIQLLGSAYNVKEGYQLIIKSSPDLIFLDIEMPDGTGFDLLQKFDTLDFQVIFITAHNQYARRAIKFGALDYLLKPILVEELAEAILRAEKKQKEKISGDQLKLMFETFQLLKQKKLPTRLAIYTSKGIIYKQINDIVRLEAKQNYTEFTFVNMPKKLLASINIGEYEEQFAPYEEFMRVHRSHLVNLRFVERFVKGENYLIVNKNYKILTSRANKNRIETNLTKL